MRFEALLLTIYHVLFLGLIGISAPRGTSEQNIRVGLLVTTSLALVLVWRLR